MVQGHMPIPLLLDMDNACGIPAADVDDALALGLALASTELELVACTACAGNCRAAESYAATRYMLHLARREAVPQGLGTDAPLRRDRMRHFQYLDSKRDAAASLLWENVPPIPAPPVVPTEDSATACIIEAARRHPGTLVIVATGSLTNLALAIEQEPELVSQVAGVVHMGGAWPCPEGEAGWEDSTPDIPAEVWRDVLRFNPLYDPEASQLVFASGIPVTIVPANVTMQCVMPPSALEPWRDGVDPLVRFLRRAAQPWMRWSHDVRGLSGMHMHDPLALAVVLWPDLFTTRTMHIDEARLLRPDATFLTDSGNGPAVHVVTSADHEAFLGRFVDRVRSFEP